VFDWHIELMLLLVVHYFLKSEVHSHEQKSTAPTINKVQYSVTLLESCVHGYNVR